MPQFQKSITVVISFVQRCCRVSGCVISHVDTRYHGIAYTGELERSGTEHGVNQQPILKGELRSVSHSHFT